MVAVFRVVNRDGTTVRECVVSGAGEEYARQRAFRHAARIGGRVFYIDADGYVSLVFGGRERAARPAGR